MSIREDALNGKITPVFETCAKNEGVSPQYLIEGVAKGVIAIPKNNNHDFDKIMAVGPGLSTKVNANIGSSKDHQGVEQELQKLGKQVHEGPEGKWFKDIQIVCHILQRIKKTSKLLCYPTLDNHEQRRCHVWLTSAEKILLEIKQQLKGEIT